MSSEKFIRFVVFVMAWAAFARLVVPASAESITVNNFSFENQVLADGGYAAYASGWLYAPTGSWDGYQNPKDAQYAGTTGSPGTLPSPADGVQFGYSTANGTGFQAYYSQAIGTIEANYVYQVTVAVGQRLDFPIVNWEVSLRYGSATGTALALIDQTSGNPSPGTFVDKFCSFNSNDFPTAVSQTLYITLRAQGTQASGQVCWDNVRAEKALIPEPGAFALLTSALAGLLCYAWRKRR